MNILVFLVWVAVYLFLVYGIARYRRAQAGAGARGTHGRNEYRPEKDPGVRFAVFLVGILLAAVTYLVLRTLG